MVVETKAKPFSFVQPVHDIAAAYEAYHQLWMSEARRNAVAPMSPTSQLARPRAGMRKMAVLKKVTPPAVAVEKPAQEKAAETGKIVAEEKSAVAEKTNESQAAVEEQTTVVTTEQTPQTTVAVEQTTTEQVNQEEVTTQMPMEDQTAAEARVASKQVAPEQVLTRPTSANDMKTAFDDFFTRWNAERIRNSRPPVAMSIPEMRRQLVLEQQSRLVEQPASSKPLDTPAETPAQEVSVDTLPVGFHALPFCLPFIFVLSNSLTNSYIM